VRDFSSKAKSIYTSQIARVKSGQNMQKQRRGATKNLSSGHSHVGLGKGITKKKKRSQRQTGGGLIVVLLGLNDNSGREWKRGKV